MFLELSNILPPNPKTLPDMLLIGNIILDLNRSICLSSLTIVNPVFSRKFILYPALTAASEKSLIFSGE